MESVLTAKWLTVECVYTTWIRSMGDQVERRNVVKRGNVSQSTNQSLLMNLKKKLIQVIMSRQTITGCKLDTR